MIGVILYPYTNYIIYNNGTIYSKKKEKFIKCQDNGNGYKKVFLYNNDIPLQVYVHKLVAVCFLHNPNNYKYIDHIDRNKENNNYLNLRWTTHSENIKNIANKPRYLKPRVLIYKRNLIPKAIEMTKNGHKVMEISRILNIPRQTITGWIKKYIRR